MMQQQLGNDSSEPIEIWTSQSNRPCHSHEGDMTKSLVEKTNDGSQDSPNDKCTLEDGKKHGWKPQTMKAPVLVTFAIFSVCIISILEYLARRSQKAGGLSIVGDSHQLSPILDFVASYLPMIIAAIYSLIWNWVDLNVKRIQPWLELSKPEGATGKNSLFLEYPVDFVGFIPFKAAKQRHWPSFYSGTIMVLIFWIITPLQSSVFSTKDITIMQSSLMEAPFQFTDSQAQASVLDQTVLNAAYAMSWLNQNSPNFTNGNYVLMPFYPVDPAKQDAIIWTGYTTRYWTNLNCWPAKVIHNPTKRAQDVHFDNGKGCFTSEINVNAPLGGINLLYIGWWSSAEADYSLRSSTCGPAAANQFLVSWAHNIDNENINISAIFCETSYFKQKVQAYVSPMDQFIVPTPDGFEPAEDPQILPDNEFNSSAFEYLLGTGVSPIDKPQEYPFSHPLNQWPKVRDRGLQYPPSNPMVGFALGLYPLALDKLSSHEVLRDTFQDVHMQVFAAAFPMLLTKRTESRVFEGAVYWDRYAIVVSRLFSALVEGFLGLVAILVVLLLWNCCRCSSMLSEDPVSLGHLFCIIQSSSPLLRQFTGTGAFSTKKLQEELGNCRFKLICGCHDISGQKTLRLVGGLNKDLDQRIESSNNRQRSEQTGHYSPIKPLALRRLVGLSISLLVCAAIGVLSYLWSEAQSLGGLARPMVGIQVNIFLTNYVPTIFATIVEPLWLVLTRIFCVLQPFYDLLSDRGTAERTINARYMALPPQLAILRAFKSGHILLGLLCITALLGNALSVGLGTVFIDRNVMLTKQFAMARQGQLSGDELLQFGNDFGSIDDKLYGVLANFSYGSFLSPWTTAEFSFLSFNRSLMREGTYSAVTTGFGVDPSCKSLGYLITKNEPPILSPSPGDSDSNFAKCVRNYQPSSLFFNTTEFFPLGLSSAEVISTFDQFGSSDTTDCSRLLLLGWSRLNISYETGDKGLQATGTMNSSFIVCEPVPKVAEFLISVDNEGYIWNATVLGEFRSPGISKASNTTLAPFLSALHQGLRGRGRWHNDTLSLDWFSYLLGLQMGTSGIYSPSALTPDPELLLPEVERLYKIIYAAAFNQIQLSFNNATEDPIPGNHYTDDRRLFLSSPAFTLSITILCVYVLMAVIVYGWWSTCFLPRMPTNIGSLLAYISASSLANAPSIISDDDFENKKFRFGRLIGPDGRAHFGIDLSEKVVPLDPKSLVKGETKARKTVFGAEIRFRGKPNPGNESFI